MPLDIPPGTPWRGWDPAAYGANAGYTGNQFGGGGATQPARGPSGTGAPPGSNVISTTEPVGSPGQDISQAIGSISDLGVTGTSIFAPNANSYVAGTANLAIPTQVSQTAQQYEGQPNVSGGGSPILGTAQGVQQTPEPVYQASYVPSPNTTTEQPQSTQAPLAAMGAPAGSQATGSSHGWTSGGTANIHNSTQLPNYIWEQLYGPNYQQVLNNQQMEYMMYNRPDGGGQ